MRVLVPILTSILMLIPADANAQSRGRGNRGVNNWNGSNWNNGNNYGYSGNYWGYRSPSWSLSYSGYYPQYYSSPGVTYYHTTPRTSYYYEPSDINSTAVSAISDRIARVEVRLQNPNDVLTIQGVTMPGTGTVRQFVSPELENARNYKYTLIVRRANNTGQQEDKREIEVKAGSSSSVDFTQPEITQLPPPQ